MQSQIHNSLNVNPIVEDSLYEEDCKENISNSSLVPDNYKNQNQNYHNQLSCFDDLNYKNVNILSSTLNSIDSQTTVKSENLIQCSTPLPRTNQTPTSSLLKMQLPTITSDSFDYNSDLHIIWLLDSLKLKSLRINKLEAMKVIKNSIKNDNFWNTNTSQVCFLIINVSFDNCWDRLFVCY